MNSEISFVNFSRAMCMIDFGMPVDGDNDDDLGNNQSITRKLHSNGVRKRKQHQVETKYMRRKNFEFCSFRDPVLFVEHLSQESLLVIDKPWIQVAETFDTQPVHRHIFGT